MPTLQPILQAPAGLTINDLAHWHQRARQLLGQPVTIVTHLGQPATIHRQWITEDGSPYAD